jgi:hypothetical protein
MRIHDSLAGSKCQLSNEYRNNFFWQGVAYRGQHSPLPDSRLGELPTLRGCLIKVETRISYLAQQRLYVHVASAFHLSHHCRAVLDWGI